METAFFTFTPTVAERDEAGLPRRFEGVAYSGGVIPGYGWHGDAAIDLSTMELPQGQVFALVDHDPGKRAGKLSARLAGNQVLVSGEFFAASDAGKEVAALFAEGAPWQMSVGIQGKVENGDRRRVELNGRALSVDTIFRNAKLREVSFVPVGADPNTSVAAFARRHTDHQPEEPTMADLDQFKDRIVELEAQLGAKDAEASNTAAELAALRQFKADSRKRDIERLQDDLALELSADDVTEFSAMPDKTFAMVETRLRGNKKTRTDSAGDLATVITVGGEDLVRAVAIATDQTEDRLGELLPDEFLALVTAVVDVNADFFVRRVLPALNAATETTLATLGVTPLLSSSPTATAGPESSTTP